MTVRNYRSVEDARSRPDDGRSSRTTILATAPRLVLSFRRPIRRSNTTASSSSPRRHLAYDTLLHRTHRPQRRRELHSLSSSCCGETIGDSIQSLMTCKPDHVMMGMSAETFWGGIEGNDGFVDRIHEMVGHDTGLTTGANAVFAGTGRARGHRQQSGKTLSIITPYQPVGDKNVRLFFEDARLRRSRTWWGCAARTLTDAIALVPEHDVMDIVKPGRRRRRRRRYPGRHQPVDERHLSDYRKVARQAGLADQRSNCVARAAQLRHQRSVRQSGTVVRGALIDFVTCGAGSTAGRVNRRETGKL